MNKAVENMSEKSICPSIRSGMDPSCSHIEDPKHSGLQFRMFAYLRHTASMKIFGWVGSGTTP